MALEDALVTGISKDRGKGGPQLTVLHMAIVKKIDVHKVFLSLCVKEVGHGQREIIAAHRGVMEGDGAAGLSRRVFLQQRSKTTAQPFLVVQGHNGQGNGDANENGGIDIGKKTGQRHCRLEQNHVNHKVANADQTEQQ